MIEKLNNQKNLEYLSTNMLAKLLDITPGWLKSNRKSDHPIPYRKFGRFVRYKKTDVQEWIGRKDLDLKYMCTKTLAKNLDFKIDWLKHNRLSDNPIPFRRFGRLVRYQQQEIAAWLKKNSH